MTYTDGTVIITCAALDHMSPSVPSALTWLADHRATCAHHHRAEVWHRDQWWPMANAVEQLPGFSIAQTVMTASYWDTIDTGRGPLTLAHGGGWSPQDYSRADKAGAVFSGPYRRALGPYRYVLLTGDGYGAGSREPHGRVNIPPCHCQTETAGDPVRFEEWGPVGLLDSGDLCHQCRGTVSHWTDNPDSGR